MECLVGIFLALGVSLFATVVGFDRDSALYPLIMVVIASYYELFAIMGGSVHTFGLETAAFSIFVLVSAIGFKTNLWLIVGALAGHGVFDFGHPYLIANPGVPSWWPMFCLTYDLAAAMYLALLLSRSVLAAKQPLDRSCNFGRLIHPHVELELAGAGACARRGDSPASFRHLERAHILAQNSTREHVRVHWRMLLWAVQQRKPGEIAGQILRILGAATKTALGLVPSGNTGGSNISPFQRMPISEDLAAVLAEASKRSATQILALSLFAALALAGAPPAHAAVPEEVRTVIIDGHRVAFHVVGSGRPAIVLISGLGDGVATFEDIARDLGKTHTVLVYDRPGYGGSEPGSGPRDASAAERELSGLLAQSGAAGPFVLSGHALGGLFAEYYAAKHPDQVSGLILEDSRPADFSRRCAIALGASKCLPPAWSVWLIPKGARGEVVALEQTMVQVEGSAPLGGKPVLVLSRAGGTKKETAFDALWTQAQDDLAARYPGSRHLTAEAGGHYIHRDQRDWFLVSVRAFLMEVR